MVAAEDTARMSRVLELFAELLEYPHPGLAKSARECVVQVTPESAEAAALIDDFASFVERTPHDTLEEVFTATFDLDARCHPYIGYHLFGEDYKRSALMLELKDLFRKHDFEAGIELPDHVAVLLRFMSVCPDQELVTEIGREALVRTLEPMTVEAEPDPAEEDEVPPVLFDLGDKYRNVLRALRLVLQTRYGSPSETISIPIPDPQRLVS